jgi:hypothetical protein
MFEKTKAILVKFDKATNGTLAEDYENEVIKKNNYTLCEFLERLEDKCEIWETLRGEHIKDIKILEHDIKGLHII